MKAALLGLGRMGLRHLEVLRGLKLDVVGASDVQEHGAGEGGGGLRRSQRTRCSPMRAR